MIACVCRVASHTMSGGVGHGTCAVTLPTGGLSSSSSSLDNRCEFHELICEVDEARQCYSDTTHKVSWVECCLDAIRVALEALEREIATLQAAAVSA